MKSNQQRYIDYIMEFAEKRKIHIWLGGSFRQGNATLFSDVDISAFCHAEELKDLIYGYVKPVYISCTHNPPGILIVIYEDGVAVDLETIESINAVDGEYFHTDDIKTCRYRRNEEICRAFVLRDDIPYQVSRLFHRSLIKFLSGKKDIGASVANEIVTITGSGELIDESDYPRRFAGLLESFHQRYPLPREYLDILRGLVKKLEEV